MPKIIWNIPNILTISRFMLSPVFFILFLIGKKEAALVIFTYVAVTDFADGWIARRKKQKTAWGKVLDPIADKFMVLLIAIILIIKFNFPIAAIPFFLSRDIISLLGGLLLSKKKTQKSWKVNTLGKLTTFLQIITAMGYLLEVKFKLFLLIPACIISPLSALSYGIRGFLIYKHSRKRTLKQPFLKKT